MGKKISYLGSLGLVLAALVLLLLLPGEAAGGAQQGLGICAGVIIPSLLPFLILSGLLSALGLPARLASAVGPLLRRLGLSPFAAAPFLLGITGGYPVGASAVASLVRDGLISPEEGARLLPFCNNTGPAFIVGVAGCAVFGSARCGLLLYLCHVLSAIILAPIFSAGAKRQTAALPAQAPPAPLSEAFSACISSAVAATANICGYVIFFSVITALLRAAGLFSALAAAISLRFDTELRFAGALLSGLLEIGNGVGGMAGLAPTPLNLSLAAFLLGFGGLSIHCQTMAVLSGTKIRCARHFVGRICCGALSALLSYFLFTRLQI